MDKERNNRPTKKKFRSAQDIQDMNHEFQRVLNEKMEERKL